MDDTTPANEPSGVSRRDMLRRSALVGGALVWTAPAVQTLATPAFANDGSPVPGGGDCDATFFIKFDLPGLTSPGGFSQSDGSCSSFDSSCAESGGITVQGTSPTTANLVQGGSIIGTVTASMPTETCITLDFDFSNGCNINESSTFLLIKTGNGCDVDTSGQLTGTQDDPANDRYTICSAGGQGGGLSHVDLCVCLDCPA